MAMHVPNAGMQRAADVQRVVKLLVAAIIVAVSCYYFWEHALELESLEAQRGGLGYVSDETWYVSASRVILLKVFHAEPRQVGLYGATVVFSEKPPSYAPIELLGLELGVKVEARYTKLPAVYVLGREERVRELLEKVSREYRIAAVVPGWAMPDKEGIHEYINWEHPPLAKYLTAASMALIGDKPALWRIPVVVAGALTTLLVFLVLERLSGDMLVGLAGSLLFLLDPLVKAMFSIAMLDGFVALFTAVALYFAINGKLREAFIAALIGGLFKATGLFTVIPVVVLMSRKSARALGGSARVFVAALAFYALVAATLYTLMLFLASLPIVLYMGLENWLKYALLGAVKWHLSIKCVGAECPISSAPWEWFIGTNSFPLYVYSSGRVLYAEGLAPLWLLSLLLLLFSLPLLLLGERRSYGLLTLFYLGVFSGYLLLWVLGGRTQYSFYSVHIAPMVYALLAYVIGRVLPRRELFLSVVSYWVNIANRLVRLLLE
jgi:predicted membrane-bound dolichyl-phosphate-mannose-protein mannosyltransferase